jgi:RNA polymerase sigma factor (sigma-70 family)
MSSAAEPYPTTLRTLEDAETARLYEVYADRMLAYCTRRLRSRSDAEDAVQTTFLYAMRALRRGVEPECESAWLHTIARNVCNWQQRTAGRHPVTSDFEIESLACAQTDDDVELLSGLREALHSLSPQQQHALVLREWHGVPPREIAVELGLTAPQTYALLTRARHALAQALTAPKRAALGLGGLAFALRAQLKALVGGASIKAAAVVTIVAVGGGGVAGATLEESERRKQQLPGVVTTSAESPGGSATVSAAVPGEQSTTRTEPAGPALEASAEADIARAASPDAVAPSAEPAPGSEPSRTPGDALVPGLPVDVPAVPGVDPPANVIQLPPVELPPLQLPPVDLPPVVLPPVNVPPVNVGPVEVPPVNVNLPPVDLPPVELPPVVVPPVEVPPLPLPLPPLLPR